MLAAGFGELAAQLGAQDLPDTRDPVASVHGTLAAFPEPWLLIFDNAPNRAAVERFLPPAGRGRVLVTSRNPIWPPGQVLEVPVLDAEVAVAPANNEQILLLDEALTRLAAVRPQAAELVKLRLFSGITVETAAPMLGLSSRSARRLWVFARAWLRRDMERSAEQGP